MQLVQPYCSRVIFIEGYQSQGGDDDNAPKSFCVAYTVFYSKHTSSSRP